MKARSKKSYSLKISPSDPITVLKQTHKLLQQAEALRNQGQYNRAEKICLNLLREFPDYYGALHTIGLIYGDKEDHQKAVHYLVKGAMINPHSWTTLTALAAEYLFLGAKEMAVRALNEALEIKASEPTIFVTLAQVYYEQREYLSAYDTYMKAFQLEPDMEEANLGLANVSIELGRYEEARAAIERLIATKRLSLQTLRLLVSLPASFIDRDVLADLDKISKNSGTEKKQEEIDAAFIRAYALDKMAQHEKSWQWTVKANNMVRHDLKKEISREVKLVQARLNWFAKNTSQFNNQENSDDDYPTSLFILGLSRSGKTSAEAIISSQAGVKRGYENPAITNAVTTGFQMGGLITFNSLAQLPIHLYPVVRSTYRDTIVQLLEDDSIFTNTSPGHIWDAPFFFRAIPNTRFIFIKRNIDDVMLRIYMQQYINDNTYSYDIGTLSKMISAYNEMIDVFSETLPSICRVINYEDMVARPTRALDEISELCGIVPDHTVAPRIGHDIGCAEPYKIMMNAALEEANPL